MKRLLYSIALFSLIPMIGFSQGTTSAALEGVVLDNNGQPLPGATVIATHQPTGTRFGASTRTDGRYNLKNLRVGGPYIIEVSFVGFDAQKVEIESIGLGEVLEQNFNLKEGSLTLDEITVVATASSVINSDKTGAGTNISRQKIEASPTISRSLADFARLIPQSTGSGAAPSFGGVNNRFNNILIDGATLNDVFGLSATGSPGGPAGTQPISLDAIEEFNVDIAPFDVTNGNFTGGQINAITRSGTNEFQGSFYYLGRNDRFVGGLEPVDGVGDENRFPTFSESFTGFRLGGPIVKNKLFFFANAEFEKRADPLSVGIQGSGAATIFNVPQATFDQISNIASTQYGYDTGGVNPISQERDNTKLLLKLDWNINQDHRLTFRHNYVNADDDDGIGRGTRSYDFGNRQYVFSSIQNSTVAELKSTLGENMFNEARLVYTRVRDNREIQADPFPQVSLVLGPNQTINMGIDRFSQANALDQDLVEFTNTFSLFKDNHEFTLGTTNQFFWFTNLFIQDAFGNYQFTDIDDPLNPGTTITAIEAFQRGIPSRFTSSFSLVPGDDRPVTTWNAIQLGFFAQDKWKVNSDLTLTYGLRVDIPIFPDSPLNNPNVSDAFPGFSTTDVPGASFLWSPRLGFNYNKEFFEGKTTQIRGGSGLFAGAPPFVWISNLYSNTGADFGRVDARGSDIAVDGFFNPNPNAQPRPDGTNSLTPITTTEVNLVDDDFKFPQSFRSNLAIDQELPYGIVGTVEGIYSKTVNNVVYRNINLESTGTTINGRTLYGTPRTFGSTRNVVDARFTNALLLENSNDGYEFSLTGQLQKTFDFGLDASVAYTTNQTSIVNNGTSSRAISNWQFNENVDVNNPNAGKSDFEVTRRLLVQASYSIKGSTFAMVYEGRTGFPFSWIYFGDANADGQSFNDLAFIPSTQNDIVLSTNNWTELDAFISSRPSLDDNRGTIADRNSARAPWQNILDFKYTQIIPAVTKGRLEMNFNVFNVLSLLDDINVLNVNEGEIFNTSFNNVTFLGFEGYVDQAFVTANPGLNLTAADIGKPRVNFRPQNFQQRSDIFARSDLRSRWQIQLGLRYSF